MQLVHVHTDTKAFYRDYELFAIPLTHILIRIDHVEPFVILFVTLYKLVHCNSIVNTPQAGLYVVMHKCIILQTAQLGVVNWCVSYKSLILYYTEQYHNITLTTVQYHDISLDTVQYHIYAHWGCFDLICHR